VLARVRGGIILVDFPGIHAFNKITTPPNVDLASMVWECKCEQPYIAGNEEIIRNPQTNIYRKYFDGLKSL